MLLHTCIHLVTYTWTTPFGHWHMWKWGIPPNGIFGPEASPDLKGCWDATAVAAATSCHLEIQVNIQARELDSDFFIWIWTADERYLDFEPRILLRILTQISVAQWLGPGSPFWKCTNDDKTCHVFVLDISDCLGAVVLYVPTVFPLNRPWRPNTPT